MTVSTITRQGKRHETVCLTLFEALDFVRSLTQLDTFVSVKIDDNELMQEAS